MPYNAVFHRFLSYTIKIKRESLQNEQLKLYESIDIGTEEKVIRRQFNLSREDITQRFLRIVERRTKSFIQNGTLKDIKEIINLFVDKVVVYEDKVEITLCYGNDLLKLVADDYGKDNSLRFKIVEFILARISGNKYPPAMRVDIY